VAHSTLRKKPAKQEKPRKDFPLFPHAAGYWAKKVRGRTLYFGKIATDPKGDAAVNLWLDEKDVLLVVPSPAYLRRRGRSSE
jgi:hypothetical protein